MTMRYARDMSAPASVDHSLLVARDQFLRDDRPLPNSVPDFEREIERILTGQRRYPRDPSIRETR